MKEMPDRVIAEDFDATLEIFCSVGHNAAIGLLYSDRGDDWIEYRLPWKEDLTDRDHRIASSVIYSIIDSSAALLPFLLKGTDIAPYPTLQLRVDHLRRPGIRAGLIVRGISQKISPDISYIRAEAHEGDPADLVAIGVGTFMSVKPFK